MSEKRERLNYIDVARGIAIIAIILGHLGNKDLNRVVFTFHVPVFYIISGYFIRKEERFLPFTAKKARSLLVPYFVASALIILFSVIRNMIESTETSNKDVFWDWLKAALFGAGDTWYEPRYVRGIGAIWFLWATFWGILMLKIILKLPRLFHPILAILLPHIGYYTRIHYFWYPLSVQAGMAAVLFMYIGYLVKEYHSVLEKIPEKFMQFLMLVSFILWFTFMFDFEAMWLVHNNFGRGWWDILRCFAACWCVILLSKMLDQSYTHLSGWMAFLGRNSILILCLHILELDVFPWKDFTDWLTRKELTWLTIFYLKIALKLVWAIGGTVLLTKSRAIKKLFCIK